MSSYKQCPQCYVGLCKKHPLQDSGAALKSKGPSNRNDVINKLYKELVEKKLQKSRMEELAGSTSLMPADPVSAGVESRPPSSDLDARLSRRGEGRKIDVNSAIGLRPVSDSDDSSSSGGSSRSRSRSRHRSSRDRKRARERAAQSEEGGGCRVHKDLKSSSRRHRHGSSSRHRRRRSRSASRSSSSSRSASPPPREQSKQRRRRRSRSGSRAGGDDNRSKQSRSRSGSGEKGGRERDGDKHGKRRRRSPRSRSRSRDRTRSRLSHDDESAAADDRSADRNRPEAAGGVDSHRVYEEGEARDDGGGAGSRGQDRPLDRDSVR